MATTLEIINGISQVLSNSYDGAFDDTGEPVKIGLRREEGNPLVDARIMDGFGANIAGERLHIKYHVELPLKEVHSNGFEGEMESMVEKVKSFIQKEYKKVTKSSLSLSDPSEVDAMRFCFNGDLPLFGSTKGNFGHSLVAAVHAGSKHVRIISFSDWSEHLSKYFSPRASGGKQPRDKAAAPPATACLRRAAVLGDDDGLDLGECLLQR